MKTTRNHNLIPQQYSIDEYLERINGKPVATDSLLRKACELVWDLPPTDELPSSLDVALLLSELGSDEKTLTVSLLSTTRLINQQNKQQFEKTFGREIMELVSNVCLLHNFQSHELDNAEQVERLRRMLLSLVDDVRAVLIKLAFRVQRLRQLANAPEHTRYAIAQESLDIFAPVANRLGIGQLKWELEDLSFRYLEPDTYKQIASYLHEKRDEREGFITNIVSVLEKEIEKAGIKAKISGRPKHIYSIWKKMTEKKRTFDELFDVRAVRVTVESVADCYVVLGLVHGQWRHIAKEFDDYIANPKENGYQSLHTAVYGPDGKTVEVQIRTQKMHEFAEHGVAAHWKYKEGSEASEKLQSSIDSLRKLLEPGHTHDQELLENFHAEIFQDRVYVLTPEGRVIDLPQGSTPLDFAYAVHTEIGHRCRGAKVNGRIVQLTYELKNGEQVEILTTKQSAPRRDWLIPHLGFVATSRARNRIRGWFRKQDRDQNLHDGKSLYEHEIKRHGVRPDVNTLVEHYKQKSIDDFYVALGRGDVSVSQLSAALHEYHQADDEVKLPVKPKSRAKKSSKAKSGINVLGVGNLLTTVANCCKPVPGDDIIGFITQGKGVSIHRKDCRNIINLKEESRSRLIEVEWGDASVLTYPVSLLIQAVDRHGLLSDITTTLSNEKANVIAVNTLSDKSKQTARMAVTVEIRDLQQLARVMDKITQLPNVMQVVRGSHSRQNEPD